MSPLVFLLLAAVLFVVGSVVLWLRHRPPSSYDSGIKAFQREMQALAPPDEPRDDSGDDRSGR